MFTRLLFCLIAFFVICAPSDAGFNVAAAFPRTGAGGACVDYDKDGRADLIIGLTIYHNDGGGSFRLIGNVPATVDPNGAGRSFGPTAWVDFDGDGIRDVLVFGNGAGSLWDSRSNSVGHPTDRIIRVTGFSAGQPLLGPVFDLSGWDVPYTNQSGVETLTTNQNATYGVAIADINRDGKPDVYLGRGRLGDLGVGTTPEWYGKDWLVKNVSTPSEIKTTDISNDLGLTRANQYCPHLAPNRQFRNTDGVGAADYNYDGYPDFFAATYRCKCNAFWQGGPGDKHRYIVANPTDQHNYQSSTGVNLTNLEQGDALHGCGVYWFDYDNDGYLDLLEARVSHFQAAGALRLWHNDRNGAFTNASSLLPQTMDTGAAQQYRCIAAGDYDNDGDQDVYVTRYAFGPGPYRDNLLSKFRGRLLRNNLVESGLPGFTDVTAAENLDNGSHADTWGCCFIDYDSDGKLDLFTIQGPVASDAMDELWRNEGAWTGHWLLVNLSPPREVGGVRINGDAIGAVVQIWIDKDYDDIRDAGEVLTRQQMGSTTGSSFWQGPTSLHFGLGLYSPESAPIRGRVFWPGIVGVDQNPIWEDFDIPGLDRSITVAGSTPPSGIPGIPAPEGPYSSSSVTFIWEPAEDIGSGVAGYNCRIGTSPGGSDVFAGSVGGALSKTITGQDGTTYYCQAQSVDLNGNAGGWSPSSDGVTVDTTPPVGGVVINQGTEWTTDTSVSLELSAADAGSGLYRMKLSQDNVSWTDWQPYSTSKALQLSAGDGVKRVYVTYSDVVGNVSEVFQDSIVLDQTLPIPGAAACSPTAEAVPVVVSYAGASDPTSGLEQVRLWYKKGLGGVWTAASCAPQNGNGGAFSFIDVSGHDTYYFALVARDNAGNQSPLPSGDGDTSVVYTGATPCSIYAAKAASDGVEVSVEGAVTADFGDCFYVEAVSRSSGILVRKPFHGMSVNRIVRASGPMSTLDTGERVVDAVFLTDLQTAQIVSPVGMSNMSLGGGAVGAQAGVAGGSGLNNLGLLVKTGGRVSNAIVDRFRLDDGSYALLDAVIVPGLDLPPDGSYVMVTGIVSCRRDEESNLQRVIRATDIAICRTLP
ncbi:MAG: FG-GAP-like repeat-containing protein [Armatimonadota bacterium]|nr:FG-GAP-like repeat-containing protein [Armatimonadota bacterium]